MSSLDRVGFFRRGVTWAVLKVDGKMPSASDRLIRRVMGVSKTSMHDFSSWVGMGSRSQDLAGAVLISFKISVSVTGEKKLRGAGAGR